MTTDRELLELAAKAAGIYGPLVETLWNPLNDDGDALLLAIALRFTVAIRDYECEVFDENVGCLWSEPIATMSMVAGPEWAVDHAAATRRAITRAAAEIGRMSDGRS